jgi:polysaccharide export outer membrane protein
MIPCRGVLGLLLAVVVAGCSAVSAVGINDAAGVPSSYASAVPVRGSAGPYVLGPGDRIRLKVYSDDQMSGEYEVDSTGFVSIPLVGEVKAAGMTTRQLERAVAARMQGKLAQKPEVNIEIAAYAPFYIYGEVKKAGEYPYRPGLTLADAIATAGGLTYRADEDRIAIRHAGTRTEQVVRLGVPVRIHPGDNIRVTERIF